MSVTSALGSLARIKYISVYRQVACIRINGFDVRRSRKFAVRPAGGLSVGSLTDTSVSVSLAKRHRHRTYTERRCKYGIIDDDDDDDTKTTKKHTREATAAASKQARVNVRPRGFAVLSLVALTCAPPERAIPRAEQQQQQHQQQQQQQHQRQQRTKSLLFSSSFIPPRLLSLPPRSSSRD